MPSPSRRVAAGVEDASIDGRLPLDAWSGRGGVVVALTEHRKRPLLSR